MTAPIYKEFTLQECDTALTIATISRECDPDFYASNATGATITLAKTETTDGMAHQISVRNDAAVDLRAIDLEIVGFNGIYPMSETLALPNASENVKSVKYYTKITSITLSGTIGANTIDIGICEICRTPLIKHNPKGRNAGINTTFDNETAIDYTLKFTRTKVEPDSYQHYTNCYTDVYDNIIWVDFGDPDLVNATDDTITNDQEPGTALVWEINSYTQSSTPTIYIEITQQSVN